MDAVLVINVGNSDMQIPYRIDLGEGKGVVEPTGRGDYDYRASAERLLEHRTPWEHVNFPLLEKYLAYVDLQKGRLHLKRVVLFGTLNPVGVAKEQRARDTLPTAELMALWLRETEGIPAECCAYAGPSSDWDTLLDFYSERLKPLADPRAVFLLGLTGGTERMNSMLLVAALDQLAGCEIEPLSPAEGNLLPWASGIVHRIREQDLIRSVRSLIGQSDFFGAQVAMRQHPGIPVDTNLRQFCLALLEYAHLRASFRFDEAASTLRKALPLSPDERARTAAQGLVDEAAALYRNAAETGGEMERRRLWEMVDLADLCVEQGRLLDLVSVVYSYGNVAIRYLYQQLGITVLGDTEERPRLDSAWAEQQPGLAGFLKDKELKWREPLNTRLALAVLDWMARNGHASVTPILDRLAKLRQLVRLRNLSPVGRGTLGVSEAALARAYGGEGSHAIVAALREVTEALDPATRPAFTPFKPVSDLLFELLKL